MCQTALHRQQLIIRNIRIKKAYIKYEIKSVQTFKIKNNKLPVYIHISACSLHVNIAV